MSAEPRPFDPYAILAALERERVAYVLIGGFARILQGTEELTHGLDLTPSMRPDNLRHLNQALAELDARRAGGKQVSLERDLAQSPVLDLETSGGQVRIVPEPAGTRRGWDDLRHAASREPIGKGLRPRVASIGDLARMAAALGREQDHEPLRQLRVLAELERSRHRSIEH